MFGCRRRLTPTERKGSGMALRGEEVERREDEMSGEGDSWGERKNGH